MTISLQSPQIEAARKALSARRFFKLIGGGSLTDAVVIADLVRVYAMAGIDCVDVAPEPAVVNAIAQVYRGLPPDVHRPLVMVSLPLDPDPHSRKIDLIKPQCIVCDACVPVCPTDALANVSNQIEITEPLCYGCGRCVDVCPTDALVLHPFLQKETTTDVLKHPLVQAVEIHSQFLDLYMLDDFLQQYGELLKDKLIALCFRPSEGQQPGAVQDEKNWVAFCRTLKEKLPGFEILQIDGQPMSGSDDPDSSLPSLNAARDVLDQLPADLQSLYVTISGGINVHTANYLKEDRHGFIAGVGMGTVARRHVWQALQSGNTPEAIRLATDITGRFKN